MRHEARALRELHSLLHRADDLGISRAVRLKLVGIIGELEAEELERYRARYSDDSRMHDRMQDRAPDSRVQVRVRDHASEDRLQQVHGRDGSDEGQPRSREY